MKKALVISGGGCKGAFACGLAEYLSENVEYDIHTGTSTGGLIQPLIALKKFVKLKEVFSSITQKSIFTVSPFWKIGKRSGLNIFSISWNLIRGKKTFGNSSNLGKLIKKIFSIEDYNEIINSGKDVSVCVANVSKGVKEYKSIKNLSYDDFCDFMQAGASAAPFMSMVEKEGCFYADGGVFDPIPIQHAIDLGATFIDVIVLRTKQSTIKEEKINTVVDVMMKMTEMMLKEIGDDDIIISDLITKDRSVKINVYYTSYMLTNNSLIFNKDEMKRWWEEGYEHGKTSDKVSYTIKAKK